MQAAQLECMDRAIGRILRAVDDNGLRDQTLVIFVNDNGGPKILRNHPLRGWKTHFHEGGIRVASLARWPGQIAAGTVVDEPLHVTDLYPTLLNLAGASLEQDLPVDGLDVWRTISSGQPTPREEIIHDLRCIRVGDWKYIDREAGYAHWVAGETQLYNIREDPYEEHNLAAENPETIEEMLERLEFHASQARPAELRSEIPGPRPLVFGEEENADPPEWLAAKLREIRESGREATEEEEQQ